MDEYYKSGISMGENLAAVNSNYVTTYNYVKIDQIVKKIVESYGLTYAFIRLFDGEIVAFGGPEAFKRSALKKKVSDDLLKRNDYLIQYLTLEENGEEVFDIAVPIRVKDQIWATVWIGLPLKNIRAAIQELRHSLFLVGIVILAIGCGGSMILANYTLTSVRKK